MYAHVHVYTHTCHVHVYLHTYMLTYTHIYTYIHMHMCTCVHTPVMYMCVQTHVTTSIFRGAASWKQTPEYTLLLSLSPPAPPTPLATYCQENSVHKLICSRQNVFSNMPLIPRLNWHELLRRCCRMISAPCPTHTRVTTHTRDKTRDTTRKLTATHTDKATSGS